MTEYLEPEQALAVVERLGFHVRDRGLLFSALARPAAGMLGQDAYPDLPTKAAALLSSLAQNHPPVDGNKRLALLLAFAFLRLNGRRLSFTNDEAFELVLGAAESRLGLEEIAMAVRERTTPAS